MFGIPMVQGTKNPSRGRYDDRNPTVSFRVTIEERELLNQIKSAQNISFKEIMMMGVKVFTGGADEIFQVQIPAGHCAKCGQVIEWNCNDSDDMDQLSRCVDRCKISCDSCKKR